MFNILQGWEYVADYCFILFSISLIQWTILSYSHTFRVFLLFLFLFFLTELHYVAQTCLKLETPYICFPMRGSQVSDAHLSEVLFH